MLSKYILAAIGLLYFGLALWCVLKPASTSEAVGLTRVPGQGESEYLTIYGGLQMSLAILFLLPLFKESALAHMLLCCVIFHACLVFFRTVGFFQYSGFPRMTYQLATGEWVILILSSIMLWWYHRAGTMT